MKKIWKNYKSTIILLVSLVIGAICGLIFKEKALVVKPLGDIFINLLFVVIVPLIFLTISSAIIKMENPKRLSKIMISIIGVFIVMSLVSALIGVIVTRSFNLVSSDSTNNILELVLDTNASEKISILERTASMLTTSDFNTLLSKDNIVAILVFAIIFGFAVRKSRENGVVVAKLINGLNDVILNVVNIIMYYAPVGLGCYMASLIATYGESIAVGFLKTFIIYTLVCLVVYFILYSLYVYLVGGLKGLKLYWQNILEPTATSLATCSSAACIPVNIKATNNIGISSDISNTTIPMGTSFHKDGSVIGSVFKIMFLVYLFNTSPSIWMVLGVAIIATILVTAVPVGGGTISEMFIISLMGFPAGALPILTIIATVIDAPATVLNVVGDTASSMVVGRLVDGKNFLKSSNGK